MATANIIYAKVSGGQPIINANFASQDIASGSATTVSDGLSGYCIITPLDGNVYAAFTVDGTVPNPAAHPRVPLTTGVPYAFYIKKNTRVGILDR